MLGGAVVVLLVALFLPLGASGGLRAVVRRRSASSPPARSAILLFAADDTGTGIVADAIRRDRWPSSRRSSSWAPGCSPSSSPTGAARDDRAGEYYALLLTAGGGMAFFVAANNLMTLFLGLEWFSICLYILTAIAVERLSGLEASLKYLIVGASARRSCSSGARSCTAPPARSASRRSRPGRRRGRAPVRRRGPGDDHRRPRVQGLRGAVPHVDARRLRGRAHPVTGFMAAATKVAALVLTLRLLVTAFPGEEELWTVALAVIVCISLAWGNLAAIVRRTSSGCSRTRASRTPASCSCRSPRTRSEGAPPLLPDPVRRRMSSGPSPSSPPRARAARAVTSTISPASAGSGPSSAPRWRSFMFGFMGFPPPGSSWGSSTSSPPVSTGESWLAIVGVVATAVSVYYYLNVIRAMYMQPAAAARARPGGRLAAARRPAAGRRDGVRRGRRRLVLRRAAADRPRREARGPLFFLADLARSRMRPAARAGVLICAAPAATAWTAAHRGRAVVSTFRAAARALRRRAARVPFAGHEQCQRRARADRLRRSFVRSTPRSAASTAPNRPRVQRQRNGTATTRT